MIRDAELLAKLESYPTERFEGVVYRATRQNLDPLVTSRSAGRWMQPDVASVLYTSMYREGALAEISFHWSQFTPMPTKPATIHTLQVTAHRTLRLLRVDLPKLGVPASEFTMVNHPRTQQIGAAVEFLGCDGLIAPCARWACDNLILFPDSASFGGNLEVVHSEDVDWLAWARGSGILSE